MSMDGFKKAASNFQQKRKLQENSPLEGPTKGFNRLDRDMSPQTREMVLRSRMPEILAFAEDRKLDPSIVAGVVEASMRMGRIPDLGMYGLAGDEALAVKDFVSLSMLGLEHQLAHGLPQINEAAHPAAKHTAFAGHYKGLADKHKQAMDWYNKAASEANKNGQPFTAAQHQAQVNKLKALHAAHSALADFHNLEAGSAGQAAQQGQQSAVPTGAGPTKVDQPTGKPAHTAHPQPGSTAAQRPEVPAAQKVEATQAQSASPTMQMPTAFLRRPVSQTQYNTFAGKEDLGDEAGDGEQDSNREEAHWRPSNRAPLLNDLIARAGRASRPLAEAKKDKKESKALGKKSDPDKTDKTMANVKCASLFQQLGHKMDHAEAKLAGKKVKSEWSQKLYKKCLSEGGGAASDEVVKASLTEPWIRDQGFVDESANLRAKWSTLMSVETQENAIKASPTTPEPIVFTVNRMIDMAGGKGSVY